MDKKQINKDRLELDYSLKLIAKSSVMVFFAVVFSKIFTYIYRILIARYYGPEVYGIFSLAIMILGWFVVFSRLGLPEGLLRYIPLYRGKRQKDEIKYISGKTLKVIFFISLILGIILFFSAETISLSLFDSPELVIFLKIFSFILPFYILLDTLLVFILTYEKIVWHSFIFNILQISVRMLVLIFLIFLGFKADAVAFSYIAGTFIAFLAAFLVSKFIVKETFGKYNLSKAEKSRAFKNLFSYSWPLLFFGLIFSVFHWTDTLIIGLFLGVEQVGFYNAAVPLALLLTITSQIFIQLFFPFITKEYSKNKNKISVIKQLSKQVAKWIYIINLPVFILMLIFPGVFINLFFGAEYLVAANALRFLAIGALFNSVFIVSNNLITMLGKSKIILVDIIIASIVNVILNIILVQSYGISGAAFATMMSLIILNLLFLAQARYFLSIVPLRKKMIRITAIALIPTILLLFLRSQLGKITITMLILLAILFGLVYIALILITRALDRNDILVLNAFLRKTGICTKLSAE
jgi:O-antigen/teichoic acid export membrane protein